MNTFFRQKLTNKTIDLLEKVEDRKTREEEEDCLILESPTILAIISLPALIILGIIVPIIAIREGDYIWGIIGMIIFGGMCSWLTGYSLFWKVVIDHEKVEYHSLFFGIGRNYPLKDITRVCYNEIEEIEVYKGKRRVFKVSSGTYGMDELRFYQFKVDEIVDDSYPDLDLEIDPKLSWALRHPEQFPVDINKADYEMLLRVPGVGVKSAKLIVASRRFSRLGFYELKKIGVVMKKAQYFITCKELPLQMQTVNELSPQRVRSLLLPKPKKKVDERQLLLDFGE